MKLATAAAVVTASLALAPLPSQAFFLNEQTINYKLHIVECMGLLFSDRHAAECGGKVTGPFNTLALPGSPSGPAAARPVSNTPAPEPEGGNPCYPWEQKPSYSPASFQTFSGPSSHHFRGGRD